ncbi:MAG: hypothetical protein J5953_06910 [Prevotella sp.]|nr:hypothetical protein [Prevotella sp.]
MSNARIVNATLTANVWLFPWLQWKNRLTYSYGDEATGSRLPLIAPLTYRPSLLTAAIPPIVIGTEFRRRAGVSM